MNPMAITTIIARRRSAHRDYQGEKKNVHAFCEAILLKSLQYFNKSMKEENRRTTRKLSLIKKQLSVCGRAEKCDTSTICPS
jgi:hypothetical protein